ncbi:hypothetical protein GQ55_8G048600 [Panicum hallii var. hallii]|uniref:DUF1618 domain-containing protein n=1 Tax=Panicum hallii var. hallii TaxID=1504633 RepID=A0A2T7CKU8_9POAL|nr:hypothetical protein GQ55_8G048600 [Panicum hallii var. hallii]
MPANDATAAPSSRRHPRRGSRRPAHVLLNTEAIVGIHSSSSTAATARTRNGELVQVSFLLRPPPRPSTLFAHSPDINPSMPPRIIYSLLRRPHPYFYHTDVGLLPRPGGHYTIAALNFTGTVHQFELHVFHSDTSTWTRRVLSVAAPQEDFPVKTPRNCGRLLLHHTTTVISIGGEGGTMRWVDLWRGILLCDVLHAEPSLRGVPLPLPLVEMGYNYGLGMELGNPAQRRGIAFIRGKGCLNFECFPEVDEETELITVRVDDWALTTWSNKKMSNSLEDWHKESVNLSIYQPTPSITGENVVYLVAREKFSHPKAWIFAVDMKNEGRVQSAAYFGIRQYFGLDVIYCPSRISKYMNPVKYEKPATTPGN